MVLITREGKNYCMPLNITTPHANLAICQFIISKCWPFANIMHQISNSERHSGLYLISVAWSDYISMATAA